MRCRRADVGGDGGRRHLVVSQGLHDRRHRRGRVDGASLDLSLRGHHRARDQGRGVGGAVSNGDPRAAELRRLAGLIQRIVTAKPEYRRLPEPEGGYL